VCLRCLAPESATPSALAYRGSILALIVGTLVAAFLVISPPESKSKADPGRTVATATPVVLATATATRPGGSPTPARTPSTPAASATGSASSTASASPGTTPAATPGGERSYTVAAGDTLSAIASQFGVTVDGIKSLNGLTSDTLQIGALLRIPPAQ